MAAKHKLVWLANRNTPKVLPVGQSYTPKPSEGKIVRTRRATADEERQIAAGKWIRVDRHDRTPGSKSYGTGSKIRPQFSYGTTKKK